MQPLRGMRLIPSHIVFLTTPFGGVFCAPQSPLNGGRHEPAYVNRNQGVQDWFRRKCPPS